MPQVPIVYAVSRGFKSKTNIWDYVVTGMPILKEISIFFLFFFIVLSFTVFSPESNLMWALYYSLACLETHVLQCMSFNLQSLLIFSQAWSITLYNESADSVELPCCLFNSCHISRLYFEYYLSCCVHCYSVTIYSTHFCLHYTAP